MQEDLTGYLDGMSGISAPGTGYNTVRRLGFPRIRGHHGEIWRCRVWNSTFILCFGHKLSLVLAFFAIGIEILLNAFVNL